MIDLYCVFHFMSLSLGYNYILKHSLQNDFSATKLCTTICCTFVFAGAVLDEAAQVNSGSVSSVISATSGTVSSVVSSRSGIAFEHEMSFHSLSRLPELCKESDIYSQSILYRDFLSCVRQCYFCFDFSVTFSVTIVHIQIFQLQLVSVNFKLFFQYEFQF